MNKPTDSRPTPFAQTYFHGTKGDLKIGDLIEPVFLSNYAEGKKLKHIYFSATLEASIWGAELAKGDGRERIYLVEPTGPIEDDPNLTNKKFPGNPTMSYRSAHPIRVVGELAVWPGHPPEQLKAMKEALEQMREQGTDTIEE